MSARASRRLATVLAIWALAMTAGALVLMVPNSSGTSLEYLGFNGVGGLMLGTIYPILGWLIATRRPENRIGWMFLVIGLSQAASGFVSEYAIYGLITRPGAVPFAEIAAWIGTWVWVPGFVLLFVTILLFPDGRLPSRRWRPVLWVAWVAAALALVPDAVAAWGYRGVNLLSNAGGRSGERPVDDDLRRVFGGRAGAHHPGGSRGRRGGGDQIPAHEQRRAAADQVARGSRRRRGRRPGPHELRHAAVPGRRHRGAPDRAARPDRDRDRDPALPPVRDRPARQPHPRLGDRDGRAGRGVRRRRSSCSRRSSPRSRRRTRSRSRRRRWSRSRCSSRCGGGCSAPSTGGSTGRGTTASRTGRRLRRARPVRAWISGRPWARSLAATAERGRSACRVRRLAQPATDAMTRPPVS